MNEKLLISVIVPAKDAETILPDCLRALVNQQYYQFGEEYEIIVVDDGSNDDTATIAAGFGVRVLRQANAGPAAARNAGADMAEGRWLAFTDADCIPEADWLYQLCRPLLESEVVGVKGAYRCREKGLMPRFVQAEYAYKYERLAKLEKIDFVDTYSAAYRRDIFLENGGFDATFPRPSVEDQEFSFRLARKGYKLVFQPAAIVYHRHDLNLNEYFRRKFGIGYWKAYMLRWLPEKAFGDSHTPPSQRMQMLLMGIILVALAAGFIWPWAFRLAAAVFIFFLLSAGDFLAFIVSKDSELMPVYLPLVMVRALALGLGAVTGILLPPRAHKTPRKGLTIVERTLKRGLDLLGGLVGSLVTAPFILAAAIAIKLDDRGPVFFYQERAGQNGKPFRVVKLRTMRTDAEKRLQEVLKLNPLKGNVYKIPNDPRITRVGKFLRRWSLDEMPQFWNVLSGEMSLVGPRPEEMWVVGRYSDEERQRLLVKPGLTGPMQVGGRGSLDMAERMHLELDYINHYSFWKDIKILLRTLPAVVSKKGAF